MNCLQGGSGAHDMLVGGNLVNVIIAGSGTNTLVAGNNTAQWAAVQVPPGRFNVSLLPPSNLVPWDPVIEGEIQNLLALQQTTGLTLAQQQQLASLFF